VNTSPYRAIPAMPPLVLRLRVADRRRIIDQSAPVVFFLVASLGTTCVPEARAIGLFMLALTALGGLATATWLSRRCVVEIAWPYRTLSWTMPAGVFGRTAPVSLELERVTSVGVAVIDGDDFVTHQVSFTMDDGRRVVLSSNVNLGAFSEAFAERRAQVISALVDQARDRTTVSLLRP
jgi:hypothetical protein